MRYRDVAREILAACEVSDLRVDRFARLPKAKEGVGDAGCQRLGFVA